MPGPLGQPGSGEHSTPKFCQGHPGVQAALRVFVSPQGNVAEGDNMADRNDMADGDGVVQGRGIKCKLCTKALKKIQALAGDDPDEVRDDGGLGGQAGGRLPVAP